VILMATEIRARIVIAEVAAWIPQASIDGVHPTVAGRVYTSRHGRDASPDPVAVGVLMHDHLLRADAVNVASSAAASRKMLSGEQPPTRSPRHTPAPTRDVSALRQDEP
jgi:hypothetical protein